jgi:hypothetical protein
LPPQDPRPFRSSPSVRMEWATIQRLAVAPGQSAPIPLRRSVAAMTIIEGHRRVIVIRSVSHVLIVVIWVGLRINDVDASAPIGPAIDRCGGCRSGQNSNQRYDANPPEFCLVQHSTRPRRRFKYRHGNDTTAGLSLIYLTAKARAASFMAPAIAKGVSSLCGSPRRHCRNPGPNMPGPTTRPDGMRH